FKVPRMRWLWCGRHGESGLQNCGRRAAGSSDARPGISGEHLRQGAGVGVEEPRASARTREADQDLVWGADGGEASSGSGRRGQRHCGTESEPGDRERACGAGALVSAGVGASVWVDPEFRNAGAGVGAGPAGDVKVAEFLKNFPGNRAIFRHSNCCNPISWTNESSSARRFRAGCDSTSVTPHSVQWQSRCEGLCMVQPEKEPRLLDRVRLAIRMRHYSPRTEEAYVEWIRRFILFHGKRHPQTMAVEEVNQFLNHLVTERHVAASTQNQALCALLFLYGEVLGQRMDWVPGIVHPKRPKRLPVVLTKDEVRRVLATVTGTTGIIATLLYGTGMRVSEALTLRVKDVDFGYNEIVIRDAKGQVDRRTVLPRSLHEKLRAHLERVRRLHEKDV